MNHEHFSENYGKNSSTSYVTHLRVVFVNTSLKRLLLKYNLHRSTWQIAPCTVCLVVYDTTAVDLLYLKLAWAKIKFCSPRRRDPRLQYHYAPRPARGVFTARTQDSTIT